LIHFYKRDDGSCILEVGPQDSGLNLEAHWVKPTP